MHECTPCLIIRRGHGSVSFITVFGSTRTCPFDAAENHKNPIETALEKQRSTLPAGYRQRDNSRWGRRPPFVKSWPLDNPRGHILLASSHVANPQRKIKAALARDGLDAHRIGSQPRPTNIACRGGSRRRTKSSLRRRGATPSCQRPRFPESKSTPLLPLFHQCQMPGDSANLEQKQSTGYFTKT